MYLRLLTRAFLELGCNVAVFCPDPTLLISDLPDLNEDQRSRLSVEGLAEVLPPKLLPKRIKYRIATLLSVRRLAKSIHAWEKKREARVDLVFFVSIYDSHFSRWPESEMSFPYPWTGIYQPAGRFRSFLKNGTLAGLPRYLSKLFRSARLKSICVWDEGVAPTMEAQYGRPIVVIPDLTDELVCDSEISQELVCFASGAPIIGSLGVLKRSKGVVTLAKLALDPRNSDLCFAFIGEVSWADYTPGEREIIQSLRGRRNVFAHFDRVDEEKIFNSCVRACDIIFAAYLDFPFSSGILTKAAVFEKPVIVSEGYLMADRVRQYHLGDVIPEDDLDAANTAMRKLIVNSRSGKASCADWQGYCNEHSFSRLKLALSKALLIR